MINIELLSRLLKYSDRYEISIQFWPNHLAVFISKDGVDLIDYGGESSIKRAVEYMERISPLNNDFWVECNVCKTQIKNWTGSTPCCGSIAWVVENGAATKKYLYLLQLMEVKLNLLL